MSVLRKKKFFRKQYKIFESLKEALVIFKGKSLFSLKNVIVMFIYLLTVIPFQPSVLFHIETSHLFCSAKQITGVCMKRNIELK